MELELGLKLTRVLDDFTYFDLQIAKDRSGSLFLSRETNIVFILTAHLKGYKRGNIKININEDGTRIGISGEKPVQETVMMGGQMYKNEIEMRRFRKVFKIPDGVDLDKIKAKFNEEESVLTIVMPKKEKGVRGIEIEEVKEEVVAEGGNKTLQVTANGFTEKEIKDVEENDQAVDKLSAAPEAERQKETERYHPANVESDSTEATHSKETQESETGRMKKGLEEQGHKTPTVESTEVVPDQVIQQKDISIFSSADKAPIVEERRFTDEITQVESELEKEEAKQSFQEPKELKHDQKLDPMHLKEPNDQIQDHKDEVNKAEGDVQEEKVRSVVKLPEEAKDLESSGAEEEKLHDQSTKTENLPPKQRSMLCVPILAGSALFVSLIAFVIHFIRTKNQAVKKKN